LFLELVEAVTDVGKRDAVRRMLSLIPTRPEPELDAAVDI
jgi:hypothetical protein